MLVKVKKKVSLQSFFANKNGMDRQNQYEVTMVFTPVMSEKEIKDSIKNYVNFVKENKGEIVAEEHWGLKQLAYPIKKKTTGIYHILEFKADTQMIENMELSFRRDENILRFLTVRLDKYAKKYNDDKRAGVVGRNKKSENKETAEA